MNKYTYDEALTLSKEYFGNDYSAAVYVDKYALRDNNGNILEPTPNFLHDRLAKEFARIDSEKYGLNYSDRFAVYRDAVDKFARIVPQGSPMAAIGNPYQLMSASNCVVIASPRDSMAGIVESGQELAQLMKRRCVEENTFVYIQRFGPMKIKDVKVGMKILSFDIENKKSTFKLITDKFITKVDESDRILIKFSNGSYIKTSKKHPLLSFNGNYNYINSGDLEIGDIAIKPEFYADDMMSIDSELGWFIGAHIGDGSCDVVNNKHTGFKNKYRFRILGDNENVIRNYASVFNKLSSSKRNYNLSSREDYQVDCWEYTNANISNEKIINNYFDGQFGSKTYTAAIPSFVRENNLYWSFLAGLIDTDGTIKGGSSIQIGICAKSVIDEIAVFLASQGVSFNCSTRFPKKENEKPIYSINIHSNEKLCKQITKLLKHDAKKQQLLINNYREFSHKKYLSYDEINTIVDRYDSNLYRNNNLSACIKLLKQSSNGIGIGALNEFAYNEIISRAKVNEINQRIFITEIVEDSDSENYIDIEVDGLNNFYAGNHGLINIHNCGVGIDISTLRPEGARVNNAARTTSGAWSFADFYSYVTRMVGQQGRRGALMITMSVHHPDVVQFATCKHDETKVTGANISIRLSNEFLKAVEADGEYEQRWPIEGVATVKKMVRAREVWDVIVNSATKTADPGLIMWDNMIDNLPAHCYPQFKTISTNPSLRGSTLVLTNEGIFPIKYLADNKKIITVRNIKGEWKGASVFCSGKNKQLVKITFTNGQEIFCTKEHKWPILNTLNKVFDERSGKVLKKESVNLSRKDKIYLPSITDVLDNKLCSFTFEDGFVLGWAQGDGWLSYHKSNKSDQIGFIFSKEDYNSGIGDRILNYTNTMAKIASTLRQDHESNAFTYCTTDKNVINKLNSIGNCNKADGIPHTVWEGNNLFIKGYIDGLFSADSYVRETNKLSTCQIVLTSSHQQLVEDVRKLLSFYGIRSHIKESEHYSNFPNGKKYDKKYKRYDLTINGLFVKKFANIFCLSNKNKQNKLQHITEMSNQSNDTEKTSYSNNRDYIVVKSVELTNLYEDVYDITVNDDTHTFMMECGVTGNCSEIALSAYDSCRLISINLTGYVVDAFEPSAHFNFDAFKSDVKIAMQMADNLVDLELELIEKIRAVCEEGAEKQLWDKLWKAGNDGRRTGLGTHGLADTLAQLKIKYDSQESIGMVDKIYASLRDAAYDASCDLASVRGTFPVYDYEKEKDCIFIKRLPDGIKAKLAKVGRRNISLLTQAPTGSTASISKIGSFNSFNVSSGVEPVFRNSYIRRKKINANEQNARVDFVDKVGDKWQEYKIYHSNVQNYLTKFETSDDKLPNFFVASDEIDWMKRIELQGTEQQYLDHSISSTINLPKGTQSNVVADIYLNAWKKGLKGITVYVEGSKDGVLLSGKRNKRPDKIVPATAPKRPSELPCDIHHTTLKGKKWIVLVGLINNEPYEVFTGYASDMAIPSKYDSGKIVKVRKGRYDLHAIAGEDNTIVEDILSTFDNPENAWATRMISASLRHGVSIDFIVELLSKDGGIGDANKVISRCLKKYIQEGAAVRTSVTCENIKGDGTICGSTELVYSDGCVKCLSCSFSKCG